MSRSPGEEMLQGFTTNSREIDVRQFLFVCLGPTVHTTDLQQKIWKVELGEACGRWCHEDC